MADKKRVVAYCRVSTDSKDQENSYENQQSYFKREIRNNEYYEYCGIYADKGISGTTLEKRKDFNRMLVDAGLETESGGYRIVAEPKFDLIVTKNTSRFARNVSVDVILKALAKNKVYVHFLDLNKTTENTDDITYIQIFSTFDERDSRDKSKKTSFGMIEGARKGVILTNNKLHGYKYIKAENRLEIDEEHAPNIVRMFEMYADGIGAHRIAKTLAGEGVKNKNGKPYTEHTIRGILSNEKYFGLVTRMKYDTGVVFNKQNPQVRPIEEQIRFEDKDRMPAIIDEDLFNRVQEIRRNRIQHIEQVGKKGVHRGNTMYGYKLFCGSCSRQYRAFQTKQYTDRKERYYRCVGKPDGIDDSKVCTSPNLSETFLNNELRSEKYTAMLAASFLIAARFLYEVMNDLMNTLDDNGMNERLAQLEIQHKEYQAKIDKGVELYLDGAIDKASVEKQLAPIRNENDKVIAKIDEIKKPKEEKAYDVLNMLTSFREMMIRVDEFYDLAELTADREAGAPRLEQIKLLEVFSKTPKKQFTQSEILKDTNRILVQNNKSLIVEFKTFEEVEQLINKYKHVMTDRTVRIFNELKASGWNIEAGWEILVSGNRDTERTDKLGEIFLRVLTK